MSLPERIARIEEACCSSYGALGFAMRGVTSWDQEWLAEKRGQQELNFQETCRLMEIETQVFG